MQSSLMIIAVLLASIGLPLGIPPLPPDSVVESAAPEECLFYFASAGTAKPNSASKNRTELLLADEQVQTFLTQISTQAVTALRQAAKGQPEAEQLAAHVPELLKALATHPASVYLAHFDPNEPPTKIRAGLVVNLGAEQQQVAPLIAKLQQAFAGQLQGAGKVDEVTVAGTKFTRFSARSDEPVLLWGMHKSLFVLTFSAEEAEALLGRLDSAIKVPAWLQTIRKKLPVQRPGTTLYINVAGALKSAQPAINTPVGSVLEMLGLSHVQTVARVTGLTSGGAISRSLVTTDGKADGLFALLSGRSLSLEDLRGIPRDAQMAWVFRLRLADVYQQVQKAAVQLGAEQQLKDYVAQFEQQLGINLEDALLKPLGDKWTVYSAPGTGPTPMAGWVVTASLADRDKLSQTNDLLVKKFGDMLKQQADAAPATIEESSMGSAKAYTVRMKGPMPFAPTWTIAADRLIVAASPEVLKTVLERTQVPSVADIKSVQKVLAGKKAVSMISYQDTPTLVTQFHAMAQMLGPMASAQLARQGIQFTMPPLPSLEKIKPHITPTITVVQSSRAAILSDSYYSFPINVNASAMAPIATALMLPGVQSARNAARRNSAANNLKQIALAMHVHHDAFKRFPASAIADPSGKPLLSWRVKILPFIEEQPLYNEFHRDEPWDSPHNKALIARMPRVYASPTGGPAAAEGKTRYVLPTGPAAMFNGQQGPNVRDISDGTSLTIMVVEAAPAKAVIWTKPDDLEINASDPLAGVRGSPGGTFLVSLADGAVRSFKEAIDPAILLQLFDPKDGQPKDLSAIDK